MKTHITFSNNEKSSKFFHLFFKMIENQPSTRLNSLIGHMWHSQKDMARDLDISDGFLSKILQGRHGISGNVLKKLALQGIDLNWLLTGEQENKKIKVRDSKKEKLVALWETLTEEEKAQVLRIVMAMKISESELFNV